MNKPAIKKHIWNLFIQANSISVAWIKSDFVEREKSSGCDINFNNATLGLVKAAHIERRGLNLNKKFEMGDGSNICLWVRLVVPRWCFIR